MIHLHIYLIHNLQISLSTFIKSGVKKKCFVLTVGKYIKILEKKPNVIQMKLCSADTTY